MGVDKAYIAEMDNRFKELNVSGNQTLEERVIYNVTNRKYDI